MKIKEIITQTRRDFQAIYICEDCNHEYIGSGYDDDHFHKNVIPNRKCEKCGETSTEDYQALTTKYPDGMQI